MMLETRLKLVTCNEGCMLRATILLSKLIDFNERICKYNHRFHHLLPPDMRVTTGEKEVTIVRKFKCTCYFTHLVRISPSG